MSNRFLETFALGEVHFFKPSILNWINSISSHTHTLIHANKYPNLRAVLLTFDA
jgi:hypothetical protein